MTTAGTEAVLGRLVGRFDPELFWPQRVDARVRLTGDVGGPRDVVFAGDRAFLVAVSGTPDAELRAGPGTWAEIAGEVRGGLDAFRDGRLRIRRDLHLGVGFLAATAAGDPSVAGSLRFADVPTAGGTLSIDEAGVGSPVLLVHGLGATKVSMLPTLSALAAGGFRAIAVDLPGFGDSVKPVRADYDAAFFARTLVGLLDALGIVRADVVGNSLGGRVALEMGLRHPGRVRRLGLFAPALPSPAGRPPALVTGVQRLLRVLDPRLGLLAPAPRPVIEAVVRGLLGAGGRSPADGWTAAGVDEFLRSFLTPRGRAAFFASARSIALEPSVGPDGLWTRLGRLAAPSLFVWGREDHLVPAALAGDVARVLPGARQLTLDCGHVPQLESPARTHAALLQFLSAPEG